MPAIIPRRGKVHGILVASVNQSVVCSTINNTPQVFAPTGISPAQESYTFPVTPFNFPNITSPTNPVGGSLPISDGGTPANDGLASLADYGLVPNSQAAAVANRIALQDMIHALADAIPAAQFNNFSKKTIFIPNGTWWFSGLGTSTRGLFERKASSAGNFQSGFRIMGQSEAGAIIRIVDNDASFQNAADPRFVIFQANHVDAGGGQPHLFSDGTGLEGYRNMMHDFTIDLGAGNDGAIGINLMSHNIGAIRRITVQDAVGAGRSNNEADRALAGIASERQGVGPMHMSHITVKGCQYGYRIAQIMCGQSIEHLRLINQGTAGLRCDSNGLYVRGLESDNSVPVFLMETGTSLNHFATVGGVQDNGAGSGPWVHASGGSNHLDPENAGYFLLVDATLRGFGGASSISAVQNTCTGAKMFLRNIHATGYARIVQEPTGNVAGLDIVDYTTGPVHQLWGQIPSSGGMSATHRTLNLTIRDTPKHPWPVSANWTNAMSRGGGLTYTRQGETSSLNAWTTLQNIIDTCPTDTLYFPPALDANIRFSGSTTLRIRGNVRHIVGFGNDFWASAGSTVTIRFEHTNAGPPVIWENLLVAQIPTVNFEVATQRDVVIMDIGADDLTNTASATGDIFLEDTIYPQIQLANPQNLYARQFNPDGGGGISQYSGGDMWIFGLKCEPKTDTTTDELPTSWTGRIEILGTWQGIPTGITSSTPIFFVNNPTSALTAQLSVAGGASSRSGTSGTFQVWSQETQNGTVRTLVPGGNAFTPAMAARGSFNHCSLYRSKM